MHHVRVLAVGLSVLGLLALVGFVGPRSAFADTSNQELTATLDGKPIALEDVGKYFCDDFAYPEIRCSSSRLLTDARATLVTALTSVDYITVFDQAGYGGAYMNMSQDYSVLSLIGWNDRIGSFKARNGETGTLYTDWFYGGSSLSFCCNSQVGTLGSYNNTFSSVVRT